MFFNSVLLRKILERSKKFYSTKVISSVLEKENLGNTAQIKGWIKSLRAQKDFVFVDVTDGSCARKLQIVIPKHLKTENLTCGSSVCITGKTTKNPRNQLELIADSVELLGECVILDGYPFNPRTKHPPDYLRQYLHLRPRTNYMSSVLRVRHALTKNIHDYLTSKQFLFVHTPILTSNDCEGAGETFKVVPDNESTIKAMATPKQDNDSVYFSSKAFLTVSGQLHLEALCRGMGNVYTLGPTFRAENSKSRLHLSEFYMLEAELAFCNEIEELLDTIENLLKFILLRTIESNSEDLQIINKEYMKTLSWLDHKFTILTYEEAKSILQNKGIPLTDEGINKEQELILTQYVENRPVFVTKWPKVLKSFYMKECEDDIDKVEAVDLLAPITGEIVGGGLRECNYEKLKSKLPSEKLNWYLELRKFGNIPTAGFGLGLERLLQVLCGINNIKDTIAFPRWPHNCSM